MRSPRPRQRTPARAGDLLATISDNLGFSEKLRQYRAFQLWEATVGPQISAHACPTRIRDGILEVKVDQPVWMQQLQLLKPRILQQLNQQLAGAELRDIFWRHGRIEQGAPTPVASPLPPLPAATLARIDALLAAIADPDLRDSMRRFLIKQARAESRTSPPQD